MSKSKNNKVMGTMGLENALYQNEHSNIYDEAGKRVLKHREVLANILKHSIQEYAEFTCEEIMSFIDVDSIVSDTPITPDSDTRITGEDTVKSSVNEANLTFDILFNLNKEVPHFNAGKA